MEKSKMIRGLFLGVGLFSAIAFLSPRAALAEGCAERCGHGDKKSLFCHVPQGNPANVQEICIADSSVPKHLEEHEGDHCGACEFECEAITCCEEQTPTEVAELSLQNGKLVLEDSDGRAGDLCCVPDNDGDGQCGDEDLCPNDALKTAPGACGCGIADVHSDDDGIADCNDDCSQDPTKTSPGICGCGTADDDADSDGTPDCNDLCPENPDKIAEGVCGCGLAESDSDGDDTPNCIDACPSDAAKTDPGACGCNNLDVHSDEDGTADCNDNCPLDPAKTSPGICGCGTSDADADNDGIIDCNDGEGVLAGFPDAPTPPSGAPVKPLSFGGGFCQLLKTDGMESSGSPFWALMFGITTLVLWTLRPTPTLPSRSK